MIIKGSKRRRKEETFPSEEAKSMAGGEGRTLRQRPAMAIFFRSQLCCFSILSLSLDPNTLRPRKTLKFSSPFIIAECHSNAMPNKWSSFGVSVKTSEKQLDIFVFSLRFLNFLQGESFSNSSQTAHFHQLLGPIGPTDLPKACRPYIYTPYLNNPQSSDWGCGVALGDLTLPLH